MISGLKHSYNDRGSPMLFLLYHLARDTAINSDDAEYYCNYYKIGGVKYIHYFGFSSDCDAIVED